jgi:glutamate dehydrogenase (NAD(P)+)
VCGTAARLLHEQGCKIIAVSDISGGLYSEDGLDIPAITEFLRKGSGNLLKDYECENVKHITNRELLTCDCEILIPAAMENQINGEIAEAVRTKIIVEGANGPTTVDADRILESKGVCVVPDILANSGGVVVSYFEWVQNIQSLTWDEGEVNRTLEKILIRAFNEVWDKAEENEASMRMGAFMVALGRIVRAKKIRGIFP